LFKLLIGIFKNLKMIKIMLRQLATAWQVYAARQLPGKGKGGHRRIADLN
jgi:hypothetical protein